MMSGYSKTTLLRKVGLTPANTFLVYQPHAEYFNWLMTLPLDVIHVSRLPIELDFVHPLVKGLKDFKEAFRRSGNHKIYTVDDVWSRSKFVFRVKDR